MKFIVDQISIWMVPILLVGIPLLGIIRKVKIYEVFVDGAKEGFDVGIRIIPYLVAILVAIGMFRGSGAMDLLTGILRRPLAALRFPPELFPLAIMRSLTGSGSLALATDIVRTVVSRRAPLRACELRRLGPLACGRGVRRRGGLRSNPTR